MDIDQVDEITFLVWEDHAWVTVFNERVEVEWINRAELVNTADNDDGGLVDLGGTGDDTGASSGDEAAVGEDGVCTEDDLVDSRHESEDGRVWDEDDGDAVLDQWLLESLQAEIIIVTDSTATDSGVCSLVVIRV